MAIQFYYNDAGTWRKLSNMYYNVAGTFQELDTVYYNDDGTWREVFTNTAVSLDNVNAAGQRDTSSGIGIATGAYQLQSDGTAATRVNTNTTTDATTITEISDNWWTAKPQTGVGGDFEVRATQTGTSGGGTFTGTLDAWEDISVTREWELVDTCNNCDRINSRTLLIEIRDAADMIVQDSASIVLRTVLFGP